MYRGSGFPLVMSTNKTNPFRNTDGSPSTCDDPLFHLIISLSSCFGADICQLTLFFVLLIG
jgi:hypothetical protein